MGKIIKILEPAGPEIFALKAYLLKIRRTDRRELSSIMESPSSSEICLNPSEARNFARHCRELAEKLTTLANQADGIKFAHK